jgi:hypothetical protein
MTERQQCEQASLDPGPPIFAAGPLPRPMNSLSAGRGAHPADFTRCCYLESCPVRHFSDSIRQKFRRGDAMAGDAASLHSPTEKL